MCTCVCMMSEYIKTHIHKIHIYIHVYIEIYSVSSVPLEKNPDQYTCKFS